MSAYITQGRFLHVAFTWKVTARMKEMEPVFNQAHDWLRYSGNCWIVWTTLSAQDWYNRLYSNNSRSHRM